MIRHFVDEVSWNEQGNSIRMRFSFRSSFSPSSGSLKADAATT